MFCILLRRIGTILIKLLLLSLELGSSPSCDHDLVNITALNLSSSHSSSSPLLKPSSSYYHRICIVYCLPWSPYQFFGAEPPPTLLEEWKVLLDRCSTYPLTAPPLLLPICPPSRGTGLAFADWKVVYKKEK